MLAVNKLILFPFKFLQKSSPYFSMLHLLHCLCDVDAPDTGCRSSFFDDCIVSINKDLGV